jgi:hypothetical protein
MIRYRFTGAPISVRDVQSGIWPTVSSAIPMLRLGLETNGNCRDLLKRHAACHDPENASAKKQKRQLNASSRVFQACKACASAKLKCDDSKPCKRCQQKGIACQYAGNGQDTIMSSQQPQPGGNSSMPMNRPQVDPIQTDQPVQSSGDPRQMQEMCTPSTSTHGGMVPSY